MTSQTEYSTQTPKKSTLFSGQYLRNHWTLDIGVLGYIRIVWPKEHPPEVLSVPPGTHCIKVKFTEVVVYASYIGLRRFCRYVAKSAGGHLMKVVNLTGFTVLKKQTTKEQETKINRVIIYHVTGYTHTRKFSRSETSWPTAATVNSRDYASTDTETERQIFTPCEHKGE
jgi:hypothetical protein